MNVADSKKKVEKQIYRWSFCAGCKHTLGQSRLAQFTQKFNKAIL